MIKPADEGGYRRVSREAEDALFDLTRDPRAWAAIAEYLTLRRETARDAMERGRTEAEWREAKGAARECAWLLRLRDEAKAWRQERQPDIGPGQPGS